MRMPHAALALAGLLILPVGAFAQEGGAAAGAAAGGVAGAVVGGPVGAAVGAAAGGAAGAAATDKDRETTVTTGSVGCESTTVKRTDATGDSVTQRRTNC